MIIGIAGTFNAGKDAAAEHLEETHSFMRVSTGDMVRELAQEKYGTIERSMLKRTADEARAAHGAGYFVDRAMRLYEDKGALFRGIAITGIRSIGEVEALQKVDAKLLFVDAPQKLRYKRSVARARGDAEKTFEEFAANESKEMAGKGDDKTVINIGAVKGMADFEIINDSLIEHFFNKVDKFVA